MDYEKKYKEALANMQELYNSMKYMSSTDALHTTMYLEKAFPELKKSEDEKIRERILLSLEKDLMATKNSGCNIKDLEECITWLKKQGEKNPIWSEEDEKIYSRIYDLIHTAAYENYDVDECGKELGEYAKIINWLKFIKKRIQSQWKPEDIHLEALRCVINGNNLDIIALKDLLEQLKRL